jgi:hypothetical protein
MQMNVILPIAGIVLLGIYLTIRTIQKNKKEKSEKQVQDPRSNRPEVQGDSPRNQR